MKGFKTINWLKQKFNSLFMKLFILSFFANMILFLLFLFISTRVSSSIIEKQQIKNATEIMNTNSQYLNLYIHNIKNIILIMSQDKDLYSDDGITVIKALEKYAANNPQSIDTAYLQYTDGRVLCSRQTLYEIVGNEELYSLESSSEYEGIVITKQYRSGVAGDNTIAFIKPIFKTPKQPLGRIIVEIKLQDLVSKLGSNLGTHKSFVILTNDGTIITDNLRYEEDETDEILNLSNDRHNINLRDSRYITVSSNVNFLNWKMCILIERQYHLKSLYDLWQLVAVMLIVYLPILFAINLYIINRYLKPLKELANQMARVDKNLEPIKLINRNDEIGQLSRSFDAMLVRINSLIKRQREDEELKSRLQIELLQSQINPHYLSNTISCIVMLLRQNQNESAIDSLRQLLKLLGYGLSNLSEMVPLSRELEFISAYAEIHRMRRGDFFSIEYNIEDGCELFLIPKMILQPFIENSFLHGFADCREGAVICISASKKEDKIGIVIEDNGIGFEEGEEIRPVKGLNRGIGIENVRQRLELLFGSDYELSVKSEPGSGTKVYISFPLKE